MKPSLANKNTRISTEIWSAFHRLFAIHHSPKTNGWIPENDGLEKVDSPKVWSFWYIYVSFLWCISSSIFIYETTGCTFYHDKTPQAAVEDFRTYEALVQLFFQHNIVNRNIVTINGFDILKYELGCLFNHGSSGRLQSTINNQ